MRRCLLSISFGGFLHAKVKGIKGTPIFFPAPWRRFDLFILQKEIMDTQPSKNILRSNKLVIPSLALGAVSAFMTPLALLSSAAVIYTFLVIPLGICAVIMARVALLQIKRGNGTDVDRNIAVVAYFLGFLPALFLCGMLTFQLHGF